MVYTHTDRRKKVAKEKEFEEKLHFKSDDEDDGKARTLEELMEKFQKHAKVDSAKKDAESAPKPV